MNATKSVKLLGVTIDNNLNFKEHIFAPCKKASSQLHAISILEKYLGKKE